MKKACFIPTIIFLTISFSCLAQDSIDTTKAFAKNQTNRCEELSETQAYKMLYENQLASNNSILSTIYYALGGLGSALLLVFASNWWFNEKKVRDIIKEIDNKIERIQKDTLADLSKEVNQLFVEKDTSLHKFQNKIQADMSESLKVSSSKVNELSDKFRTEIKKDINILSSNYQKQLETFNENYRQQLSVISESFNSQNNNLMTSLSDKENSLKELIKTEENRRTIDIDNVSKKMHRVEYYMWDSRGVPVNAFSALISELEYELRDESDIKSIGLTLRQMKDILGKCTSLFQSDINKLKKLFEDLPEDNELYTLEKTIVELMDKLPLF